MTDSSDDRAAGAEQTPELKPLDVDGFGATAVGTVLWALALVVLLLLRDQLVSSGNDWWIAVAATGLGLGVLGLAYTYRRRAVYRRASADSGAAGSDS